VNALSKYLRAEVHRDGKIYVQEYEKGKPLGQVKEAGTSDKTGTIITFFPDETIFTTTEFNYEILEARLRELAFLNKGIRLRLVDKREKEENGSSNANGSQPHYREAEFYSEHGLKEFVEFLDETREKLTEKIFAFEGEKNDVRVEVALQYNTSFAENVHSYVNNINTIDGGTHLAGFRRGLTRTLKNYAEKSGMLEKIKFDINGDDFREGLTAVISVKVPEPQFEGQTKGEAWQQRGNGDSGSVSQYLLEYYLEENPRDAVR
jgi:DNA gyrase subunit B